MGTIEHPINPIGIALGPRRRSWPARWTWRPSTWSVLERAAQHKGMAFIEIYQNCNVFNDGAENVLRLEHGKPVVFGKNGEHGIRLGGPNRLTPELIDTSAGPGDALVFDEKAEGGALGFLMSRLERPQFPMPIGIFRAAERPTYEVGVRAQIESARAKRGPGNLDALLRQGETWTVT
jgi:2-oxoglutarate ferredoxin oxidoreductase subunit beta